MTRNFLAPLAAAILTAGAALADPAEISRSITDIAAGADRHDWTRVRGAFAETVTTDYTSLWGGDPVTQPLTSWSPVGPVSCPASRSRITW